MIRSRTLRVYLKVMDSHHSLGHRQDDFKNNVSEVELLQESMKGHIYDV